MGRLHFTIHYNFNLNRCQQSITSYSVMRHPHTLFTDVYSTCCHARTMRANSALENYSALHNTMLFFPRMRTILCVAAYDPRGVLRHLLQIEITINNQGE